jgi:hypothetical protein
MIRCGINLFFGNGYDRQLPEGWALRESPEDWAIGVSPDGQEYFLTPEKAYPRRQWTEDDVPDGCKVGEHYLDEDNAIAL